MYKQMSKYYLFLCVTSILHAQYVLEFKAKGFCADVPVQVSFNKQNDIVLHTAAGSDVIYTNDDTQALTLFTKVQTRKSTEDKPSHIIIKVNDGKNDLQQVYGLAITEKEVSIVRPQKAVLSNPLYAQNLEHKIMGIAAVHEDGTGSVQLYSIEDSSVLEIAGEPIAFCSVPLAIALNDDATLLTVTTEQEILLFALKREADLVKRAIAVNDYNDDERLLHLSQVYRSPISFNPTTNDCGSTLTVTAVTSPAHGSATFTNTPNPTITYTPQNNYSGPDAFTYTVTDASGLTATGNITVTVRPVANGDTITVVKGSSLTFNATVNDCGTGLVINSIVTQPTNGTATFVPGSTAITYTSNSTAVPNSDSFTYTVIDASGNVSAPATVTVNLVACAPFGTLSPTGAPVNTQNNPAGLTFAANGTVAAVANISSNSITSYSVNATTGLLTQASTVTNTTGLVSKISFNAAGTLLAAAGKSGANGLISIYQVAANGTLTFLANTSFTNSTFQGVEFSPVNGGNAYLLALRTDNNTINSYSVNGTTGVVTAVGSQVVALTTAQVFACSPVISGSVYVSVGGQIVALVPNILSYRLNTDGTISAAISAAVGITLNTNPFLTMSYSPDGRCLVTSSTNVLRTCTVNQTNGILTLITTPVPTVVQPTSIAFSPNSQQLCVIDNSTNGSIVLYNANTSTGLLTQISSLALIGTQTSSVAFEQSGNYVGVSNSTGTTTPGTIQIYAFTRANQITQTTTCNNPVTFDPTNGCSNYTITATSTPTPSGAASFVNTPTPSITYTPASGFSGIVTFNYTLSDGTNTSTSTVTVTVNPRAVGANATFSCSQAVTAIPTNDCGTAPITRTIVTPASIGTASIVVGGPNNGQLQYLPNPGVSGNDNFTYRVTDGTTPTPLQSAPATVSIVINPVAAGIPAGSPATVNCSSTNNIISTTSLDCGTSLTRTIVDTTNVHGTVTINGSGQFVYTPTTGYSGPASFTYTVTDSAGHTSTAATVNIQVRPVAGSDAVETTATC